MTRRTLVVLRNHAGSGAFNFSSVDLPSSMWGGGTYTLSAFSWASGGILEKYSLLFTIRTSPILTDTDSDGLNDTEETTAGSDGWITDPQLSDTDGDTWGDAYEISRGTNPLSVDTDGDGAQDNVDLDPLHNLVVVVKINKIHHGASPWCTPELVGIARVNDAYTWVTEHRMATEDGYFSLGCMADIQSTAVFGMTYYSDVPDDVSVANLRVTAWSVNPARGDDNLVDYGFTYLVNSPWYSTTTYNGNSWISYEVSTIGLGKAKTLLVTDGQVTVTSSAGQVRMATPDRFFVFALNLTSASSPFVTGIDTILVPRSVFLDSKLKADFDAGNFSPLPNADMYGDDLSKAAISDGVAAVIAGTLTGAQASDVLNRLLLNASGGTAHTYVDVTNTAFVANLPSDVVKILAWAAVVSGPTGTMPQDFWSKIGAIASAVVNTLVQFGQMIYKGLVALGTFLVNLAQAIADWGMKALGTVWNAAETVVAKVGEALQKLANWILDFVRQVLQAVADVLLRPILDLVAGWASASAAQFMALDLTIRRGETIPGGTAIANGLMFGALPDLVFGLSTLFVGAMLVIGLAATLTPIGAILAVAKEVIKGIIQTAIEHWIASTVAVSAMVGWVLSNVAGGLELGAGLLNLVGIIWGSIMVAYAVRTKSPVLLDAVGLGIAILGTLVAFNVLPLVQYVGSRVVAAIIGTAMSATGLVLALIGPDAPGLIGNVDEFIDAASLGFDLAKTETAVADCSSGGVC